MYDSSESKENAKVLTQKLEVKVVSLRTRKGLSLGL